MEQSPSWEANWFCSQSRNSPHFWIPKVHHRTHKCPPPFPILINVTHIHKNFISFRDSPYFVIRNYGILVVIYIRHLSRNETCNTIGYVLYINLLRKSLTSSVVLIMCWSVSDKIRFSCIENRMIWHRWVKCNYANIKEMEYLVSKRSLWRKNNGSL